MDDPSIDSTLKYGRSTALFVALKENAEYVYTGNYCEKINKTLISQIQSSKVSDTISSFRSTSIFFSTMM